MLWQSAGGRAQHPLAPALAQDVLRHQRRNLPPLAYAGPIPCASEHSPQAKLIGHIYPLVQPESIRCSVPAAYKSRRARTQAPCNNNGAQICTEEEAGALAVCQEGLMARACEVHRLHLNRRQAACTVHEGSCRHA